MTDEERAELIRILQRAQLTTSEAFWLNALLTRLSAPPAPPAQPE